MAEKSDSRFAKKMIIVLMCGKGAEEQRRFPQEGAAQCPGRALLPPVLMLYEQA